MARDDEDGGPRRGATARVLQVLVTLGAGQPPHSLADLAEATGLAKPTLLRLLRVLADEGFAAQDRDSRWRLTTLVFELGCSAVGIDHAMAEMRSALRSLAEVTGETVVYVVYDAGHTVYVETVESQHPVHTSVKLGNRVPALATATGRAMLAWLDAAERDRVLDAGAAAASTTPEALRAALDETRTRGYAYNRDGLWPGVWGVGAPVFDRFGEVVGAVGMSAPVDRLPDDLGPLASAVVDAAGQASARAGAPVGSR
jgi:DNA-binding IclR family transcriptional regulator